MGRHMTTIQIQNKHQIQPEQFSANLCAHLKSKGFVPTIPEDADETYMFSISDNGNWITLSSAEYEVLGEEFHPDLKTLAKTMDTCCIGTSVYDSDIVALHLYDAPAKQEDTVLLGRLDDLEGPSMYKGKRKCWEPLLTNNSTWQHLQTIWSDDYVFAEEALQLMAPLLGMDPENILADYSLWNWQQESGEKPACTALHFKKEQPTPKNADNNEPTKLVVDMTKTMISGEPSWFTFYNTGRSSKGLTITFIGDCFKDDAVTISEISVEKPENPGAGGLARKFITATAGPEKVQFPDGRHGISFRLDDFEFSPGINIQLPATTMKQVEKYINDIMAHQINLRFTPILKSGDTHKLSFHICPHENWEKGQDARTVQIYKTHEASTNANKVIKAKFDSE